MKLRGRNTYKNRKIILLHLIMWAVFWTLHINLLLIVFVVKHKVLIAFLSILSLAVSILFYFLMALESNNYKWKYYRLGKNKEKIKQYCIEMGYDKKQAKQKTHEMIDNYRQNGMVLSKYDLQILLNKKQAKFNYSQATDVDKLEYIVYYLYKCFDGTFDILGFKKYMKEMGFSLKEIKRLFTAEYVDDKMRDLIEQLTGRGKVGFTKLYFYEIDIVALLYYISGVSLELPEQIADGIFASRRHICYKVVKRGDGNYGIAKKIFSYGQWHPQYLNGIYADEKIAMSQIMTYLEQDKFAENWSYLWRAWGAKALPQNCYDVLDYYGGVQGEGHSIYFDNNESGLEGIENSLSQLLPKHLFENFKDAKSKFLNRESTDNNDKYFYEHIAEIEKIMGNFEI